MNLRNLLLHAANLLVPLVALVACEHPLARALASGLLFFAVFSLFHDLLHCTLGLSRAVNEPLLLLTGACIGVSGPAARRIHLIHHARPFADDDFEGRGAQTTFLAALLRGPWLFAQLPRAAWLGAGPNARRAQLQGWLFAALFQVACAGAGPRSAMYALAVLLAQATMPGWAAWTPHRGPAWMHRLGERLDGLGWGMPIALAHHERHHAEPWTATFDLPARTGG